MAKRHKNKGHKGRSHGRGLSKLRGSSRGARGGSNGGRTGGSFPELMDLSTNVYLPEVATMRQASRRPGRMIDELRYTNDRMGSYLGLLRKRPVAFVRAKEVYDPSGELKRKKLEAEAGVERDPQSATGDHQDNQLGDLDVQLGDLDDQLELSQDDESIDVVVETEIQDLIESSPDSDFITPSSDGEDEAEDANEEDQISEQGNLEFDEDFSIGNVYLNLKMRNGALEASLPTKYQAAQNYIRQVMSSNRFEIDDGDDELEMDTSEEEFIMSASIEDDIEALSIKESQKEIVESDSKGLEESDTEKEPEYGFLEEDYLFDISSISITNVRLGADLKQFYLRSFKVLGTDDFIWIDGDDLSEFLIDNGMASHRVDAYYNYILDSLGIKDEVEEQPNYSDVYISETEEEEEEEDEEDDDEDDDGLEDLVAYTQKGKLFSGTEEMLPTQSIKTKGKTNRKRLDLEHLDDLELIESLQDQYILHKKSRFDKKQSKQQEDEYDLLAKYPYTIHIKDIRDEFEKFLQDGNRQALTFPPLDPHGLKTIGKMANFYNMKSRKFGKGIKSHIVVIKNKRTFHSLPRYNEISVITRQRPVFNRTDAKRTKDEIANSKDGSKSRHANKGSLHVKEGDIVGEKAPEIGQENIGRRLLERLGWSKGEGLGADHNKGISEPIMAKIKNSKLGIK